ncbi:P-loop containing nucleoside triphosphate hydrolase protein, partial [Peziza echinospora]
TLRWETTPPTSVQLDLATRFFTQHPPKFLWSAEKFKKIDFGDVPEVAFLGRSNVGKSSLLNALLNHHSMATTSSKPGRTRLMNAFSINQGKLVLLDMPGYGHAARAEWGVQIMKYLLSRKQFKRAFLLIDAHHGPKETDFQMLDHLGASGIPYQVVLSKIDKIHRKPQDLEAAFTKMKELLTDRDHRRGTSVLGEILATASSPAKKGEVKIGMADLRWAVMVAGGLEGTSYS